MKSKIALLGFLVVFAGNTFAASEARITFKVLDDSSKPLKGIPVGLETYTRTALVRGLPQDIYEGPTGKTDTNGIVVLTMKSEYGIFSYGVGMLDGYYLDRGRSFVPTGNKDGKWQPWNPTIEIIFRPIVNPIAMYARQRAETHIPKPNQKYGYDLMMGDWVAPVGKGQMVDMYFEVTGYWKAYTNYDSTLIVSFARPEDGLQKFEASPPAIGSIFRSPREAPLTGYLSELSLRMARQPDQTKDEFVNNTVESNNFFFRVRTVLDEYGKIKSALYGKIYRGFQFGGAAENSYLIIGDYYLNPEPNSRNVEFDPKQNLFKKLKPLERVTAP